MMVSNGEILQGHVLNILKTMPDESVQCVVTSPPYWGLRDYKTDGQIGLEKTPEEYVQVIVEVFREVKRVLRSDGTLFLNLGDSYWGGKGASGSSKARATAEERGYVQSGGTVQMNKRPQDGNHETLKPKDLCGIPWRVAFALQADGWWLRSDIIWSKPNPMPESVTDRPTKSHEYIFLLTKSQKYYFDQEAISEVCSPQNIGRRRGTDGKVPANATDFMRTRSGLKNGQGRSYPTRNVRTVWKENQQIIQMPNCDDCRDSNISEDKRAALFQTLLSEYEMVVDTVDLPLWSWWVDLFVEKLVNPNAELTAEDRQNLSRFGLIEKLTTITKTAWEVATQPFPEAHFATFPEAIPEKCIKAGSKIGDTILDPFFGAGTVALVAEKLNRKWIGIEMNPDYVEMAKKRILGKCWNVEEKQENWIQDVFQW